MSSGHDHLYAQIAQALTQLLQQAGSLDPTESGLCPVLRDISSAVESAHKLHTLLESEPPCPTQPARGRPALPPGWQRRLRKLGVPGTLHHAPAPPPRRLQQQKGDC